METIRNKILIVDDEPAIRMLYSDELTEEGYDVITCGDRLGFMKAIRKESPDLIVMDIRLGSDNGLDILRDLRDTHSYLPVIMCSVSPAFEHDMKSIVADYYVTKSSDLRELKAIIQMAIHGENATQSAKPKVGSVSGNRLPWSKIRLRGSPLKDRHLFIMILESIRKKRLIRIYSLILALMILVFRPMVQGKKP